MKKAILILTLFITFGCIQAQKYGDPAFYPPVTSIKDASTVQFRQDGQTRTSTWSLIKSSLATGSDLLNQENNWTENQTWLLAGIILGANSFISLPYNYVSDQNRLIYIPVGDSVPSVYVDGKSYRLLSKGEADNTYAVDTENQDALNSTYVTLSTTQTIDGNKDATGYWKFNNMRTPIAASVPTQSSYAKIVYDYTQHKYYGSYANGIVKAFATEEYADAGGGGSGVTSTEISDSIKQNVTFFSIPLDRPAVGDIKTLFCVPHKTVFVSVKAVLDGVSGDQVKMNLRFGTLKGTATSELFYGDQWITSLTGETLTGDIYEQSINAGTWVWVEVTGVQGSPETAVITVAYKKEF